MKEMGEGHAMRGGLQGGAADGARQDRTGASGPDAKGAGRADVRCPPAAIGCPPADSGPHSIFDAADAGDAACALEVDGLTFSYPVSREPVLQGVSLRLPAGSFGLLVGGTGSGKSTLLSLAKPQIAPAGNCSGTIHVFGEPVGSLDDGASARTIGFVFQRPDSQIVCDSVWHEMAFGLENLGVPQDAMRRLVAETSYFFGIDDWFRQSTDALSGGRKQLLALASTLVMKPRLLLLDEPTAQLDPITAKNFLHALFRVNRELGCTVLVATHEPRMMVDYATHAYRLEAGAVHLVADLDELRERPRLLALEERAGEGPTGLDGGKGAAPHGVPRSLLGNEAGEGAPAMPAGGGRPVTRDATAPGCPLVGAASIPQASASVASASLPAIEFGRVWFRYDRDGDWVLRNLDLAVASGGIHALVGGNGCGKSTLLALAAGVQRPQRGSVRAASRSRALLPQDPRALFVEESAEDELMEWSRMGGYGRGEVAAMLDRLGLAACARLHPYDLSGGQQQLLALGKLLLIKPVLLLMDEPTKGLDASARSMLARTLRDLRDGGATVLLASHDLDFVEQVADAVSMVFDGEIACTEQTDAFFRGNVYYRP